MLVGTWTGGVDRERLDRVLAGELPFDEATMVDVVIAPEATAPEPVAQSVPVSHLADQPR